MHEIGFIGAGNMATALLNGIINSSVCKGTDILISDTDTAKLTILADKYGVKTSLSNSDVTSSCKLIVLAVKPQVIFKVLEELDFAGNTPLLLSIAAGIPLQALETSLPDTVRVIRTMPNTPALVGAGCTALCKGSRASAADMIKARSVFEGAGLVVDVEEKYINAVTAVSGSGPAYFFMVIEALSDAGVRAGLSREVALKLAAQTAFGSAKMVLESGIHPAALKDMVTSPAGTTIEAVNVLENFGVRAAFMEAAQAALCRAEEMEE